MTWISFLPARRDTRLELGRIWPQPDQAAAIAHAQALLAEHPAAGYATVTGAAGDDGFVVTQLHEARLVAPPRA